MYLACHSVHAPPIPTQVGDEFRPPGVLNPRDDFEAYSALFHVRCLQMDPNIRAIYSDGEVLRYCEDCYYRNERCHYIHGYRRFTSWHSMVDRRDFLFLWRTICDECSCRLLVDRCWSIECAGCVEEYRHSSERIKNGEEVRVAQRSNPVDR